MRYPARFEPAENGGFVVSFRDIPEAITQGDSLEEAVDMARDALLTAMEFYFEDEKQVPSPSAVLDGEELVSLPVSVWVKVLLLNQMIADRVKRADLARRLSIKPQQVTRLVDLEHTTKIDELERAFHALGKTLVVSAV